MLLEEEIRTPEMAKGRYLASWTREDRIPQEQIRACRT